MSAVAKLDAGNPRRVEAAPIAIRTDASVMEDVIAKGDLSDLKPEQRARLYMEVCRSLGLNPLTKPFDYITLSGRLTLYATRAATDQLRKINGVTIHQIEERTDGDLRIVRAHARDPSGREDMDIGAVNVKGLAGDALANACMKALTKAKRRVTLSICGLGWLDESETETVPGARPIRVSVETGEIVDADPGDDGRQQRAMARLHALGAERGITHEHLHDLAVARFDVPGMTACTLEQLTELGTALKACDADQALDLATVARAISESGDDAYLDHVATEVDAVTLPGNAKAVLLATIERVRARLAA